MKKKFRIESDSLGQKKIEVNKIWGAQTQRSLENFKIGIEKMPKEIIVAFGYLKRSNQLFHFPLLKRPRERFCTWQ